MVDNSSLIKKFPNMLARYSNVYYRKIQNAIGKEDEFSTPIVLDVGCGSGVDTFFFAKKGFEVYAIDRDVKLISNLMKMQIADGHLTQEQADKIHIIQSDFEKIATGEIKLPKSDIVLANNSLPFYKPEDASKFGLLMQNIFSCIKEGGILSTSMFGKNDEWAERTTTFSEEEYANLLKSNGFVCSISSELEAQAPSMIEDDKHWNIIESVYRKPFEDEKIEAQAQSVDSSEVIEEVSKYLPPNYNYMLSNIFKLATETKDATQEVDSTNIANEKTDWN